MKESPTNNERQRSVNLDDRSIRLARLLRDAGLGPGDVVALFMENNVRFHEIVWAALRSGMYLCPINRYLTAEEAEYIVTGNRYKRLLRDRYWATMTARSSELRCKGTARESAPPDRVRRGADSSGRHEWPSRMTA